MFEFFRKLLSYQRLTGLSFEVKDSGKQRASWELLSQSLAILLKFLDQERVLNRKIGQSLTVGKHATFLWLVLRGGGDLAR